MVSVARHRLPSFDVQKETRAALQAAHQSYKLPETFNELGDFIVSEKNTFINIQPKEEYSFDSEVDEEINENLLPVLPLHPRKNTDIAILPEISERRMSFAGTSRIRRKSCPAECVNNVDKLDYSSSDSLLNMSINVSDTTATTVISSPISTDEPSISIDSSISLPNSCNLDSSNDCCFKSSSTNSSSSFILQPTVDNKCGNGAGNANFTKPPQTPSILLSPTKSVGNCSSTTSTPNGGRFNYLPPRSRYYSMDIPGSNSSSAVGGGCFSRRIATTHGVADISNLLDDSLLTAATTTTSTPSSMPPPTPGGDKTTVMLRNVPYNECQVGVLNLIREKGFSGRFSFFYAPLDFNSGNNLGYAFINFLTTRDVDEFFATFDRLRVTDKDSWSQKELQVCWARVQGHEPNVEHYRNSPVNEMPETFRPMIFDKSGDNIPFPRPDEQLINNRRSGVPLYTGGGSSSLKSTGGRPRFASAQLGSTTRSTGNAGGGLMSMSKTRNSFIRCSNNN